MTKKRQLPKKSQHPKPPVAAQKRQLPVRMHHRTVDKAVKYVIQAPDGSLINGILYDTEVDARNACVRVKFPRHNGPLCLQTKWYELQREGYRTGWFDPTAICRFI